MEPQCSGICSACGLVPLAPRLRGATQLVARSAAMQAVLRRVARFARSEAPVAVLGETGTGKEVIARVLHANSRRAAGPFVPVNVAALPTELLESELFGHGKGAFTGATQARRGLFEAADKGTLFLDEVAELPLPLQAKLLRALQDGEIRRVGENQAFATDVRIVCATHRNLLQRVRDETFREDLYYRLKVLTVDLPPLRERRDDILPLATLMLGEEASPGRGFTEPARAALLRHRWPGNVRELQNAIKHGAALATGEEIEVEDLPDELNAPGDASEAREPSEAAAARDAGEARNAAAAREAAARRAACPGRDVREPDAAAPLRSLAEVEREHILAVLDACAGSQARAAGVLGIARNTLWRKLREYADGP